MSKNVYSWKKFNEEISIIKGYKASEIWDKKDMTYQKADHLRKLSRERIYKFLNTKIGYNLNPNDRSQNVSVLYFDNVSVSSSILLSVPVCLYRISNQGHFTYSLLIPFLIEINGMDIKIIKTSTYLDFQKGKLLISQIFNTFKNHILSEFEKEFSTSITDLNVTTLSKEFDYFIDGFEKKFYSSPPDRKVLFKLWKLIKSGLDDNGDYENIMKEYYGEIKSIISDENMDLSVGQVKEFIKGLKINDFYGQV